MRYDIVSNSDNLRMMISANNPRNHSQAWRHERNPVAHQKQIGLEIFDFPPYFDPVERID